MIFDIKMEDFKRKARYVAGGHMTDTPATITYASVVSRETVMIALMIAALNDLEVKSTDIANTYVSAPCKEICAKIPLWHCLDVFHEDRQYELTCCMLRFVL